MKRVEKFVANLYNKTQYVIHTRNLKQALNHGLVLKKVHTVNQSNHNASLKLYVNMNKE